MIGRSGSFRGYYAASAKLPRFRRRSDCRTAMIRRRKQGTIPAGSMLLLHLGCDRWRVPHMSIGFLLRSRTRDYATLTTVKGHVRIVVHNDGPVDVNIPDNGCVHVYNSRVVEEGSATPFAAVEAVAAVAESVINAAIKSNLRPPITGIPNVHALVPAPVTGGPKQARFGRFDPRTGNPVVAIVITPSPIAGSPQIPRSRADGLLVHRQSGRANAHRNADADLCGRRGRNRR